MSDWLQRAADLVRLGRATFGGGGQTSVDMPAPPMASMVAAPNAPDVAGLEQADSDAVVAEGMEPGLMDKGTPAPVDAPPAASFTAAPQQRRARVEVTQSNVNLGGETFQDRLNALQAAPDGTVVSTRAAKAPVHAAPVSMRALAQMGASGGDQVSQNGVHIGAIRALDKQIAQLEAIARKKGIKV